MRSIPVILLSVACSSLCLAQGGDDAARLLVMEVQPELVVTVKKHDTTGADLVEVSALDSNYPKEVLGQQCTMLGELTADPVRGLTVFQAGLGNDKLVFRKARFGTSGLIDRTNGTLNLEAIAKAFHSGAKPVKSLIVTFQAEAPNDKTIRTYANEGVVVYGTFTPNPQAIEYRVRILTDKTAAISIPGARILPAKQPVVKKVENTRTNPLIFVLIGLGSIAAGVLVYLRILGSATRKS